MEEDKFKNKIFVNDYGDMLAQLNDMELVDFKTDGGCQGEYMVTLKKDGKLYYYSDYYGSCSGCDWLECEADWGTPEDCNKSFSIEYKKALEYAQQTTPKYIVPEGRPLEFTFESYEGFTLIDMNK